MDSAKNEARVNGGNGKGRGESVQLWWWAGLFICFVAFVAVVPPFDTRLSWVDGLVGLLHPFAGVMVATGVIGLLVIGAYRMWRKR